MHPVLIQFGDFAIHTYGVLLAAGFLLAMAVSLKEARRVGINPDLIMDLAFYVLVAAIVGSRIFYVITNWHEFSGNFIELLKFWRGGLVFYGGLIFAFAVGLWFVRKHHLDFRLMADLIAPSIAIGQSVGRLGCFFAGCCFGLPSRLPWAVTFTDINSLAPLGIPLHPTQIYESAGTFAIFLILMVMRRKERFQGRIFWYYLLLYSILRFFIEFYRGDPRGWVIQEALSTSQAIAIPAVLLALYMVFRKRTAPGLPGRT